MIRVGLISDTHINNIFCHYSALEKSLEELNHRADIVLHAGDIADGVHMYRGQQFELESQAIDDVIEKCKDIFGILQKRMYFILGNHDLSYQKHFGLNLGEHIQDDKRIFLGEGVGDIEIARRNFRILHPAGSRAYSISYPAQKYLRERDLRKDRIDWLVLGHYHTGYYLYVQGVNVVGLASFLNPTEFYKRRGYDSEIGYDILIFHKNGKFTHKRHRFK